MSDKNMMTSEEADHSQLVVNSVRELFMENLECAAQMVTIGMPDMARMHLELAPSQLDQLKSAGLGTQPKNADIEV